MADNAVRDQNFVTAMIALLESDGQTITAVKINPSTHHLQVDDGITGSDLTPETYALRDQNNKPVLMALSSVDGVTPVELYVTADGKLLIDSTE